MGSPFFPVALSKPNPRCPANDAVAALGKPLVVETPRAHRRQMAAVQEGREPRDALTAESLRHRKPAALMGLNQSRPRGCISVSPTQAYSGVSRRVIKETTTSVMKPSGIVTIPGWLNGTIASAASRP